MRMLLTQSSPTMIQTSTMLVPTKVSLPMLRSIMAVGTMVLVVSMVLLGDLWGCMVASVATLDYTGVLADSMGDLEGSTVLSLLALVVQRLKNQTTRKTKGIIRKPRDIKNLPQKVRKHIESIR